MIAHCATCGEDAIFRETTPPKCSWCDTPYGAAARENPSSTDRFENAQKRAAEIHAPTPASGHDELTSHLRAYHDQHGESPTGAAWSKQRPSGAPAIDAYRAAFGSWREALIAAGLEPTKPGRRPRRTPAASDPQPRPAGDTEAGGPTETPGVPPSPPVVEAPPAEPVAQGGRIDAIPNVLAPGDHYLNQRQIALIRAHVRCLIVTLESAEITDPDGAAWFDQLADRVERVLGLTQEDAA